MAKRIESIYDFFQSKEHTLRSLKKENRILRAEIKRLVQIIKANETDSTMEVEITSESERLWHAIGKESALLSSSTYLKYLVSRITGGSLFALSKKAMGYFRRFKLVSSIMRIISSALAVIGTGAFFIFLSGAIVFIIPFIVAFCASIYFLGTVWRARAFRMIEASIDKKNVYVLFPSRKRPFLRDSEFRRTLDIISNDTQNQNFTIVVSPYVFSSVGFSGDGKKFYPIVRYEKRNVCILRKHSFFLLRKRVLGLAEDRTVYIY